MAKKRECEEERENRKFKNQAQKTENQWETQETHEWGINSTSQNVPRGHNVYGAATTY